MRWDTALPSNRLRPHRTSRPACQLPPRAGFKGGGQGAQTVHILFLANDRLRLGCRALLIIVPVRPNFYSARPQASHQLNPAHIETALGSKESPVTRRNHWLTKWLTNLRRTSIAHFASPEDSATLRVQRGLGSVPWLRAHAVCTIFADWHRANARLCPLT